MSRGAWRALALLAAVAAGACGNKTPVRPPELIQPRPASPWPKR